LINLQCDRINDIYYDFVQYIKHIYYYLKRGCKRQLFWDLSTSTFTFLNFNVSIIRSLMSLNGSCYAKGYLCLCFKDLNKLSDR